MTGGVLLDEFNSHHTENIKRSAMTHSVGIVVLLVVWWGFTAWLIMRKR